LRIGQPGGNIFDALETSWYLRDFHDRGLQVTEPHWNFGQFEKLGASLPQLRAGIWYHIAPENVGKSMWMINLAWQILQNNENCYWLDFSLDDSKDMRYSYILARTGEMPIGLTLRAGDASLEDRQLRTSEIGKFAKNWSTRHKVFATYRQKDGQPVEPPRHAERIIDCIKEARKQIGPDAKLWVTIDGFHDIRLEARAQDENERQRIKSQMFKDAAPMYDAMIMMSAHCRKDSRRRGMNADSFKGDDSVLYDAVVVTTVYSDVNLNREAAELSWQQEGSERKLPVHEIDIQKNKAGGNKDVLFYNFLPERCWDFEVDEATQTFYRSLLFGG
jgi:hypothetical protein